MERCIRIAVSANDTLALQFAGPQKGVTQVTVRENR